MGIGVGVEGRSEAGGESVHCKKEDVVAVEVGMSFGCRRCGYPCVRGMYVEDVESWLTRSVGR